MPSTLLSSTSQDQVPTHHYSMMAAAIGLMAMVFWMDLQVPLGVAGGVPYIAVILLTLWLPNSSSTWVFATLCSVLTLLGFWWSPSGGELWQVVSNRSLAFFAIWSTSLLSLVHKKHIAQLHAEGLAFRTIMNLMPCMVFARNQQGHIIAANQASKRFFGRNEDELKAHRAYGVYPTTAQEISAREIESEMIQKSNSQAPRLETYVNDQGERHEFLTSKFPFCWPDTGEIVVGTIAVDEAERQEELARLRLTERVIDSSPEHISIVGKDYRYQRVNPAYERAHGKTQRDIVGLHIQDLVGSTMFHETVKLQFDQCLQGREIHYEDWFLFGRLGRRYMAVNYTPLKDEAGHIDGVVVISRDMTEQQLANEGVAYQASLLSAVEDGSSDAIFVKDLNGKYLRINPAGAEMMGLSSDQVVGNNDLEIFGKELGVTLIQTDQKVIKNGAPITIEERLPIHSHQRVFSTMKAPLKNFRGNVSGIIGVARDITHLKHIQEALENSEERFRHLYESAPLAYFSSEPDGQITSVNARAVDLLGFTADDLLGRKVVDLYAPTEFGKKKALEVQQKTLVGQEIVDEELQMQKVDGTIIWVNLTVRLIYDDQGNVVERRGMVQDISQRKEAQEALLQSEYRYRSLIETAGSVIIGLDCDGHITEWNREAESLYGKTREEIVGQNYLSLFLNEKERQAVSDDMKKVLAGTPTRDFENPIQAAGGQERVLMWNVDRLLDHNKSPIGLIAIGRDITERKNAEKALQEAERFARSTMDALSTNICVLDPNGTILRVNKSWRTFAESNLTNPASVGEGQNYLSVCDHASGDFAEEAPMMAAAIRQIISGDRTEYSFEYPCHSPSKNRWFLANVRRFPGPGPERIVVAHEDITKLKQSERLMMMERLVLETIATGQPLQAILDTLTCQIEQLWPGVMCSILLLDEAGTRLFPGSAPSLPREYIKAISGLQIGSTIGSCGTAAYTGIRVITENIAQDSLWEGYHELARTYGLQACWSVPIIGNENRVLGTFAMYYAEPRTPDEEEITAITTVAHLASIGIERRRTEALLAESEQRFDLAIWGSNDGLWDWSNIQEDGEWWSPRFYELLGYEFEEIEASYSQFQKLLHPDDVQSVMEAVEAHMEHDVPFDVEYRLKTKCGAYRWLHARGKKVLDEKGQPIRMAGSIQDIQDRRQGEIALQESEQRLALALEATSSGTWDWNVETGEVLFGDQWLHALGYTREQIAPDVRSWESLVHPDDVPIVQEALQKHFAGETLYYECINRFRTANGAWRWNLDRGRVVEWTADGKPLRMVGTDTDISARMQAEQASKESEARLQAILDNSPGLIFLKDLNGHYLHVNQQFKRMFRIHEEEVIGRTDDEVFPVDQALQFKAHDREVLESQQLLEFEEVATYTDGFQHTSIVHKFPLFNDSGEMFAIGGITTDITARKQAEEALKQSQKAYEDLVNSVEGIVWECEFPSYQFTFVSQQAERLLGYPIEQWLTQPEFFSMYLHHEDRDSALEYCLRETTAKRAHELEYRMISSDGRVVWLRDLVTVVVENDQPVKVRGVMIDITERKKSEAILKQQALMFQTISEGIILTDPDGMITDWNPGAEDMFGYRKDEVLGKSPAYLHREEDSPHLTPQILKGLQEKGRWRGEITFVKKDGEEGVCETTVVPLAGADGQWRGTFGVNHDITKRRQAEERLQQYVDGLEREISQRTERIQELEQRRMQVEKLAALAQVAAGVAHEINNPLASIGQSLEVLKRAISASHPRYKYIGKIQDSVDRMAHIVRQLYQLYRPDTASREPVSIRQILRLAIEIMKDAAKRQDVSLVENVPEDLPLANVSRNSVTQVLCNIIQNALDVSRSMGVVQVGVEQHADSVVVLVTDKGPGISTEVAPHIFEPFFTTKDGTSFEGGMGLGLAVSYRLIESCGGSIDFSTELGQGTTFRITIPLNKSSS